VWNHEDVSGAPHCESLLARSYDLLCVFYRRQVRSSGRVGSALAAVGNHEAKALLFLAMQPGEEYGISALHRLFLEIQGDEPAHRGTVTLPQKYAIYSFEPLGLAHRVHDEHGFIRHVRDDPDGTGTAVAGHLLASTEHYAASLSIFGKTALKDAPGSKGEERGLERRYAILRALLDSSTSLHHAALAARIGSREATVGRAAEALANAGLLDHDSAPTYGMKSSYRLTKEIDPSVRHSRALGRAVADYLNLRRAADGRGVVVTRDEIEEHLRTQARWRTVGFVRDQLQRVMAGLAADGQVSPIQDYVGQVQHSRVAIKSGQRELVKRLVGGLDQIEAGDRRAIIHARAQGDAILADPARVHALMAKAFAASKLASNPMTRAEKQHLVLTTLQSRDGLTTEEIADQLAEDLSTGLVRATLRQLTSAGQVRGKKQPDGPYKRWYLA
jgi:predicted transcriptional regulator